MKRILCTVAVMMLASVAFAGSDSSAGSMTPAQAMDAMMNCPVCSAWFVDPTVGPNVRYSISPTKNGYVSTMMTADESALPAFMKADMECERRASAVSEMTQDQKDRLCPVCVGQMKFMSRKDVTVEHFKAPQGFVTVASATTPDGVNALHQYAMTAKSFNDLVNQAAMEMGKEPPKSKM